MRHGVGDFMRYGTEICKINETLKAQKHCWRNLHEAFGWMGRIMKSLEYREQETDDTSTCHAKIRV